MGIPPR